MGKGLEKIKDRFARLGACGKYSKVGTTKLTRSPWISEADALTNLTLMGLWAQNRRRKIGMWSLGKKFESPEDYKRRTKGEQ